MPGNTLVVDDALHLRNAGYTVHMAADGVEGGYGALRSRPDLFNTDVNMPYMNGFEFIAAIRGEGTMQAILVIFLTTASEGESRGKELGAVDYVAKPVRADRLLSLVAAHINGGRHLIG